MNQSAVNGNSQDTLRNGWGVGSHETWHPVLVKMLNDDGYQIEDRTFGVSGDTTSQMFGRGSLMFLYGKPSIVFISGGSVNDLTSSTGTATAGASNSITLGSGGTYNSWVGNIITITSGTGNGQSRKITYFDPATNIAKVDSNWSTTPNATSVYSIAALTSIQTQLNNQALIKSAKYCAIGADTGVDSPISVWNQADLPATGLPGQRYVVMNDTSTTGGCSSNYSKQHDTITGDYSAVPAQSVWEFRSYRAGELGWGRVAITGTPTFYEGVDKIVLMSTNYLNWTTGGDNVLTGVFKAENATLRQYIKAAADAEGVEYCNFFDLECKLITGGEYEGFQIKPEIAQGDNSAHSVNDNQHSNAYGHRNKALGAYYFLKNRPTWLISLT